VGGVLAELERGAGGLGALRGSTLICKDLPAETVTLIRETLSAWNVEVTTYQGPAGLDHGPVIVVTRAGEGWPELPRLDMPLTEDLLQDLTYAAADVLPWPAMHPDLPGQEKPFSRPHARTPPPKPVQSSRVPTRPPRTPATRRR